MLQQTVPRIESLRVKKYRSLRDVQLRKITPLSVFLGPNGSGKSALLDVFAFLTECFTVGLRHAWDKRGRFRHLRTRGSNGAIEFELKYREKPSTPLITYHLSIEEGPKGAFVDSEWMGWRRGSRGRLFRFLDFRRVAGRVSAGETPDGTEDYTDEQFNDPSTLAVSILGRLTRYPRLSALRSFVIGWHHSSLCREAMRGISESESQKQLSMSGDNPPNAIRYLKEHHPEHLEKLLLKLLNWGPRLEKIDAQLTSDVRFLLRIKDGPFEEPIQAKFVSDGTLRLLSYLALLHQPAPSSLIAIEHPETHVHPRLLPRLTEECRMASSKSQLIITTHSPYFVDELHADEVWILYRDEHGFTVCKRAADMRGINEFIETGGKLGHLWMEGFFDCGDPLTNSGGPIHINSLH